MGTIASLTKVQKEAILLLQAGTFLEYFDLMLYVHMAVLLNELFFPKTDPHTAALLTAFAFCSTWVLRPFGALIFGFIGDHIGRKTTVVLTTMMMATSCIIMANLPTYAQIGITASWAITFCRAIQGVSSMAESVGAGIYLTEITTPPSRYPIVAFITVTAVLGTTAALGVAMLVTSSGFNWRLAFWIGAGIALVGTAARGRLRETPDFVDMKKRMKIAIEDARRNKLDLVEDLLKGSHAQWQEKINLKTALANLFIHCSWPLCLYFVYIYCAGILKNSFGYTPEQIIHHNLILSIIQLFSIFFIACLSYKVYPLKILKVKLTLFSVLLLLCPYLLNSVREPFELLLLQSAFILLVSDAIPAVPILLMHFPILKRFTYASFIHALSRALTYIATAFGLVYLTEYFMHWGLLFIFIPMNIGFAWGLSHFESLEKTTGNYPIKNWRFLSPSTRKKAA